MRTHWWVLSHTISHLGSLLAFLNAGYIYLIQFQALSALPFVGILSPRDDDNDRNIPRPLTPFFLPPSPFTSSSKMLAPKKVLIFTYFRFISSPLCLLAALSTQAYELASQKLRLSTGWVPICWFLVFAPRLFLACPPSNTPLIDCGYGRSVAGKSYIATILLLHFQSAVLSHWFSLVQTHPSKKENVANLDKWHCKQKRKIL